MVADVAEYADVEHIADRAIERFGRIDTLDRAPGRLARAARIAIGKGSG